MADANSPDEDIRSGKVRKSPGVALADLGDVEDFDRRGKRDQLYAFQFVNGAYKRKEGIISSDGATSMDGNLDLGGNRIVRAQEAATKGYVDSRIRVRQVTSTVKGRLWEGNPIWLEDPPSGHKLRKLRIARIPPGKSIYYGRIVLLNLWVGSSWKKGMLKVDKFTSFYNMREYYDYLRVEPKPSTLGEKMVVMQGEGEEDTVWSNDD